MTSWLVHLILDGAFLVQALAGDISHCAVFLYKTLYSHNASLHPSVYMGISELNAGGDPAMD